jgi:hypothetical protein
MRNPKCKQTIDIVMIIEINNNEGKLVVIILNFKRRFIPTIETITPVMRDKIPFSTFSVVVFFSH